MYVLKTLVKTAPALARLALGFLLLAAALAARPEASAVAGDGAAAGNAPQPHMMYFYNPSCRLCTKTNEIVGAAETKYAKNMTSQRFNIADPEHGTDNVLYMFDLLDAMQVPDDGNITLVVFLGTLEADAAGEKVFTPVRVLVEGDEIIDKLDGVVREFLDAQAKGGKSAAFLPPTGFFRLNLASASALAAPILPESWGFDAGDTFSEAEAGGSLKPAAPAAPAAGAGLRPPGSPAAMPAAPAPAPTVEPVPAGPAPAVTGALRPGATAAPGASLSPKVSVTPRVRPAPDGGAADSASPAAPLRPKIRRADAAGGKAPALAAGAESAAQERAESKLRFSAITIAALADSVNPCAFATIIILVAMMSSAKRTRREIIAVCLSFTAAVFVTYFGIGLFLYKVIFMINERGGWFLVVADLIYYFAFLLCVVFGLLSLWDAYKMFRGDATEEMVLQLPKAFKKRINVAMAKGVRAEWLMVGVFIAGVTVSFFEAACTGQVYLPTIISLAKISFWHSMALLTWYNFLFILPLLIIFGLVFWGVTSAQLAAFFKNNVAWIRLALGLVFVLMGILIWHEMYWPPGYRG